VVHGNREPVAVGVELPNKATIAEEDTKAEMILCACVENIVLTHERNETALFMR
jgi:hypothetical protein